MSGAISFHCPHCALHLKVKEEHAGKATKCPACKQPITVPLPSATGPWTPPQQLDGEQSSLAQAGLDGGVTLEQRRAGSVSDRGSSRSVGDLLARRKQANQRYIIDAEIARGGMGAVLRAVDGDLRREVAVKYLLDEKDPRKKARFIEEAQINGQLEHPNIVPVYDLKLDPQGRPYLMMKLVRGRDLKSVFDELRGERSGVSAPGAAREYTLGRLLNVLVNVCNGLAFAHAHGVIHRDLKPANIMLGDFGEVYIMDWGLAKVLGRGESEHGALTPSRSPAGASVANAPGSPKKTSKVQTNREAEADLTQEGSVLGTPVYMAPEQAAGRIQEIDQRSDVYALGAILYEMLTLEPPVDKEGGYLAIMMRVASGEIVPPEQRVLASGVASAPRIFGLCTGRSRNPARQVPRELSAIAMKALAKEKEKRYQTVEEFRQDIERFQEGRSVSAKEDTTREMLWKFVKRNPGFSAGAAMTLLVLVVSLWFVGKAWWDASRARDEMLQAQRERDRRTQEALPALVEAARLSALNGNHDGAHKQLNLALLYDAKYAPAHLLRGQLFIAQMNFAQTEKALEAYSQHAGQDALAARLRQLCRHARAEDGERLLQLVQVLDDHKIYWCAAPLLLQVGKLREARGKLVPLLQKRIETAWPGLGQRLAVHPDGSLRLDLHTCTQVTDLTQLAGMPLTSLDLGGCGQVRDLTPLQGIPLTSLNLWRCGQVRDLTPLKGMPLTSLILADCGQVRDLTPLKGMPLTSLNLNWCGQVRDLTPLLKSPLRDIELRDCPADPGPLRAIQTLERISDKPAAEFWKEYDAQKGKK